MYFLTNSNYHRMLLSLDLNIPLSAKEKKSFYFGSILRSFPELDIAMFSENHARMLVISEKLFTNFSRTMEELYIVRTEIGKTKWVYELSTPSFHCNKDCEYLKSNFNNARLPNSLSEDQRDAYRAYFIANCPKETKHSFENNNLAEIRLFFTELKSRFNLEEEVNDLINNHNYKKHADNTGVSEFAPEVNLLKEKEEINNLIVLFNQDIKSKNFDAERVRKSVFEMKELAKEYAEKVELFKENCISADLEDWFNEISSQINCEEREEALQENLQEINTISLDLFLEQQEILRLKQELEMLEEINKSRSQIFARIMSFHFKHLSQNGFDVSKMLLSLLGFKPCSGCCR